MFVMRLKVRLRWMVWMRKIELDVSNTRRLVRQVLLLLLLDRLVAEAEVERSVEVAGRYRCSALALCRSLAVVGVGVSRVDQGRRVLAMLLHCRQLAAEVVEEVDQYSELYAYVSTAMLMRWPSLQLPMFEDIVCREEREEAKCCSWTWDFASILHPFA